MKLTIHGAAGEVTGSMYEIYCEQRDMRLLIDVGSLQSDGAPSPRPFPFDPESVDSLLLTHAHIDHIGELPRLVREGFAGRIYATRETMLLGRANLMSAARLDTSYDVDDVEAAFQNAVRAPGTTVSGAPLWHVNRTVYGRPFPVFKTSARGADTVFARMLRSSHLQGACGFALSWHTDPNDRHSPLCEVVFFGDTGPTYKNPATGEVEGANLLMAANHLPSAPKHPSHQPAFRTYITESTYGADERSPTTREARLEGLRQLLHEAVANRQQVVIPSFSLGRTQDVLFDIHVLRHEDPTLAALPVFAPAQGTLADQASELLVETLLEPTVTDRVRAKQNHAAPAPREARLTYANRGVWEALGFDPINEPEPAEAFLSSALGLSSAGNEDGVGAQRLERGSCLDDLPTPCVVVASSGMGRGGASERLLKDGLTRANVVIAAVGYAGSATPLGALLRELHPLAPRERSRIRRQTISIFEGERVPVARCLCTVVKLAGYSGHATRETLTDMLLARSSNREVAYPRPDRIIVTHGDPNAQHGLATALCTRAEALGLSVDIEMPQLGTSYDLQRSVVAAAAE